MEKLTALLKGYCSFDCEFLRTLNEFSPDAG